MSAKSINPYLVTSTGRKSLEQIYADLESIEILINRGRVGKNLDESFSQLGNWLQACTDEEKQSSEWHQAVIYLNMLIERMAGMSWSSWCKLHSHL